MKANFSAIIIILVVIAAGAAASAATSSDVQNRINTDIAEGKPIVVHVIVALCDNLNQGIVPVPEALGNGKNPGTNLYWGALYGIRSYLTRSANWTLLGVEPPDDRRILERIVLHTEIKRDQRLVSVFIVADAWDGAAIEEATQVFLAMTAGKSVETLSVTRKSEKQTLRAGGASHLLAYIGHNGLMDFALEKTPVVSPAAPAKSAIVLACASKSYFTDLLQTAGAHPLLLTTGLMAPEAYTLNSALRSWIAKGTTAAAIEGAAEAYNRYQKCGPGPARRLFWGQP